MLKSVTKKFIKLWLKVAVKLFIWRHKPDIIAVSGSTNKYTVKDEIYNTLKGKYHVRTNPRNFNAEIGVPLSILNLPVGYNSIYKWSVILLKAMAKPFLSRVIPQIIVLELAIDKPKDMNYLLSLIKPKITVITNIQEQYIGSFENLDKIASEYLKLAQAVPEDGLVLLNADDSRLLGVKDVKAKIWYYGERKDCDYCAYDVRDEGYGIFFKVKSKNYHEEVKVKKYGRHHMYARLAAIAVKKYYNK